jgi:hypothetical protein
VSDVANECAVGYHVQYHAAPFVAGMRAGGVSQWGGARSRFRRTMGDSCGRWALGTDADCVRLSAAEGFRRDAHADIRREALADIRCEAQQQMRARRRSKLQVLARARTHACRLDGVTSKAVTGSILALDGPDHTTVVR